MESKGKRGPRQPENSLPNTIVIQLVSPQPQVMPLSVHAMPLLSGSKPTVEQQRRLAPPVPFRGKSPTGSGPPRGQLRVQPAICPQFRSRAPTKEFGYFPPQGICHKCDCANQPFSQGRNVWMEYVYHPGEKMAPIYSQPPLADMKGSSGHCSCCNCRSFQRSSPEPDNFMENQNQSPRITDSQQSPRVTDSQQSPRVTDSQQSRPGSANTEGRRDQSTNTDGQQQQMDSLKAICETLGQAIVASAIAAIEAANTLYSPSDSSAEQRSLLAHGMAQMIAKPKGSKIETVKEQVSSLKTGFLSSVELLGPTGSTPLIEHLRTSGTTAVVYPKTPIDTPLGLPLPDNSDDRMESGSSPRVYMRSSQISNRPAIAGKLPMAFASLPNASVKGRKGPVVRRRLPTEGLLPLKQALQSGPTSPSAAWQMITQPEVPDPSPPVPAVVTLPPDPDLSSYSQTDDPSSTDKI